MRKAPISWFDIINDSILLTEPGIPLTSMYGNSDLASSYGRLRYTKSSWNEIDLDDYDTIKAKGRHAVGGVRIEGWVVDLDEPAGMGFALRLAAQHVAADSIQDALLRWAVGETTDADRARIARIIVDAA